MAFVKMQPSHLIIINRCASSEALALSKVLAMLSIVYHVPVVGWMLKEAMTGSDTARVLFVVNLMLAWLLAAITFGYPGIIIPALAAVPTMFVILISITKG